MMELGRQVARKFTPGGQIALRDADDDEKLGRDERNVIPLWERMRREVAAAERISRSAPKVSVQGDLFAEYQPSRITTTPDALLHAPSWWVPNPLSSAVPKPLVDTTAEGRDQVTWPRLPRVTHGC